MAAGIEIYNYVTNQKGSPAIYSDTLANRPAAGFIGRLFVSTDTLEIYRDNGTTWDLISGGGGPAVNIYNSDGSLTAARTMTMANHNLTFEGGANPARLIMSANNNVARIFSFRTAGSQRWAFRVDDNETGSNAGGNWYLRAYDDAGTFTISPFSVERASGEKSMLAVETLSVGSANLTGLFNVAGATYQAGLTMTGGNPHGASHNNFTLANAGNLTFANSIYLGAQSNVLRLQANNSGTVTMQAASPGIRTAASTLNQVQYNTTTGAALTYTHVSVMQALGIYRLFAAGSLTVTNAYGLIINDLNEYGYASSGGGALAITNRWGIYQDSTTDLNYFGGNTLIGTNVTNGSKLRVSGSFYQDVGNVILGANSGNVGIQVTPSNWSNITPALQIKNASIYGFSTIETGYSCNAYYDGSWKYISNGFATSVQQSNGVILFLNAASGLANNLIGWNVRAQLKDTGNFCIGTSTDSGQRVIIDSSMRLVPTSTVPTASAGAMYYDSATNKLKLYDGTNWVDLN